MAFQPPSTDETIDSSTWQPPEDDPIVEKAFSPPTADTIIVPRVPRTSPEFIQDITPPNPTPAQEYQAKKATEDKLAPPMPTPGTFGQAWHALNQGPLPEGEHISQTVEDIVPGMKIAANAVGIPSAITDDLLQTSFGRKLGKLALGGEQAGEDLASYFLSPLGIATLGIGSLPRTAQRAVSLAFAYQMASQLPGQAKELAAEVKKPFKDWDYQKVGELTLGGTADAIFAATAAAHGIKPSRISRPTETTQPSTEEASANVPQVGGGNTKSGEVVSDSPSSNAEPLGNALKSPPFGDQGLSSLDIPSQRLVMSRVLSELHKPEVYQSIIKLVPVDVVNNLVTLEHSSNVLLHDQSVNPSFFSVNSDGSVSVGVNIANKILGVISAIPSASKSLAGKILDLPLASKQGLPTTATFDLNKHEFSFTENQKQVNKQQRNTNASQIPSSTSVSQPEVRPSVGETPPLRPEGEVAGTRPPVNAPPQQPSAEPPAPPNEPARQVLGSTFADIGRVAAMSPDQFVAAFPPGPNNLTASAWRLGQSIRTPQELNALAGARDNAATPFHKSFFREAYEVATGTGSAGFALSKDPNYKPPMPASEPAKTDLPTPAAPAPSPAPARAAASPIDVVGNERKNLPDWAREAMVRARLDPARTFNDIDIQDPNVKAAIQSDPTLTNDQKQNLLKTGSLKAPLEKTPTEIKPTEKVIPSGMKRVGPLPENEVFDAQFRLQNEFAPKHSAQDLERINRGDPNVREEMRQREQEAHRKAAHFLQRFSDGQLVQLMAPENAAEVRGGNDPELYPRGHIDMAAIEWLRRNGKIKAPQAQPPPAPKKEIGLAAQPDAEVHSLAQEAGYSSPIAFEKDYAKNADAEVKETKDEFLKRRYCSETIPKGNTKARAAHKQISSESK